MSFERDVTEIMHFLGMNENLGDHDYSSTQVQLPNDLAEKVLAFGLSIPDEQIFTDPNDTTLGRELDIHVTVKYGLTTSDAADVHRQLNWLKEPLEVTLEKVSCFYGEEKDKPYDVVKIEVTSSSLDEMHELLSKLPNEDEYPEYTPHVTIAYVKKGFGKIYEGRKDFDSVNFKFDSIMFKDGDNGSKEIILGTK
jgi:2'-5' RNA ligase